MKLLFCTHDIDSGGSARSLSILLKRLASRHEVTIVTTIQADKKKGYLDYYKNLGIYIIYFPWGWLPVDFVGCDVNPEMSRVRCAQVRPFIPKIQAISQKADVICFNGYPASYMAPILPTHISKYLIAREVLREDSPGFIQSSRLLNRYIKKAIAIGPVESSQLDKMKIPNQIVYNTPADASKFATFPPLTSLHLGVFSQFVPCKGLDILVQAARIAASALRKHSCMIHIFGGNISGAHSPLESQIRNYVNSNYLDDLIVFEGWTENVEAKMKSMHCLIRPDITGSPWGRDVIEAMSIGRPIIAAGNREIFIRSGQTGWLIPPGDADALAATLISVVKEPQHLLDMGKNAFEFAVQNFDPEINAKNIERIICEV